MKRRFVLVAGVLLALSMAVTACHWRVNKLNIADGGPRKSETRALKGFEEIEVSGSPTVYYTQADSFTVRVEGPERFVEDILTDVSGRTLKIRNRGKVGIVNITADYDDAAVYVTSPDLTLVQVNGSGDFKSERRVDTDNMRIVLRGSGDIDFNDIICDRCATELTGSGDIDIDRLEARSSMVTLIGSGDIEVRQWKVIDTDVALRGSGDISVDFNEGCRKAKCQLTGSGDISLSGHLGQFSGEKHGSGDINIDKLSVENQNNQK